MIISGAATAVVARVLHPDGYGAFTVALATWTLVLAASDFGFDLALGRDLAVSPERSRALLHAAYRLKGAWALSLAVLMGLLALLEGVGSRPGSLLLALAPSVLFSALGPARGLFAARYIISETVVIDVVVTVLQVLAMIVTAITAGPIGVAITVSAFTALNYIAIAFRAERHAQGPRHERGLARNLLAAVLPLGLMGFMSKVYLTVDLVLLGWLVSDARLGQYAAASKLLALIFQVPGFIIAAALPAFAATAARPEELERIVTRVWHLLAVMLLPVIIATAIFASPLIRLVLGNAYGQAADLLRVLLLAAAIGTASNLLGTILVVHRNVRPLLLQNAVAIALNVGGNLLLVPHYGVEAAAWLTVATEAFVCGGSLLLLRREFAFGSLLRTTAKPTIAVAVAGAASLLLFAWPLIAFCVGVAAFFATMTLLRAWPDELRGLMPSRGTRV